MTDKTLQDRLRDEGQITKTVVHGSGQVLGERFIPDKLCTEAADALDAQAERIKALDGALRELSAMYSHAWDTVNGDLLMMSGSIPRFEAAHKRAEEALK